MFSRLIGDGAGISDTVGTCNSSLDKASDRTGIYLHIDMIWGLVLFAVKDRILPPVPEALG